MKLYWLVIWAGMLFLNPVTADCNITSQTVSFTLIWTTLTFERYTWSRRHFKNCFINLCPEERNTKMQVRSGFLCNGQLADVSHCKWVNNTETYLRWFCISNSSRQQECLFTYINKCTLLRKQKYFKVLRANTQIWKDCSYVKLQHRKPKWS